MINFYLCLSLVVSVVSATFATGKLFHNTETTLGLVAVCRLFDFVIDFRCFFKYPHGWRSQCSSSCSYTCCTGTTTITGDRCGGGCSGVCFVGTFPKVSKVCVPPRAHGFD